MPASPNPNPTTSYTLFERLCRDVTRREAVGQFVDKYTPFIVSRIRRTAPYLQASDVEDVTQQIFHKICGGLIEGKFSFERKNFRHWFAGVIRLEVLQDRRQQGAKRNGKGDAGLSQVAAPDTEVDAELLRDLERYELHRALQQVQHEVRDIEWQAFQLATYGEAVDQGRTLKLSATEVGNRLGIPAERVHAYKFKVLQRLREILRDETV